MKLHEVSILSLSYLLILEGASEVIRLILKGNLYGGKPEGMNCENPI